MGKVEAVELLISGAAELGVPLNNEAVTRFTNYLSLLQTWGRKMNLSSRLVDREIVIYHFLDSLSGARWITETPAASIVDLGAGAGFPSLPLKIALNDLLVLLLESSNKKVSFCREVIRALHLKGAEVHWGRGEVAGTLPDCQGRYDWSVSRALGRADVVARLSFPFLKPGGRILLYKGALSDDEIADLDRLCSATGALWESHPVFVPFLDGARTHIIIRK